MYFRRHVLSFSGAVAVGLALSAGPAAGQGMTGPIDTGTVRTGTVQLNQAPQVAPAPAPARKPAAGADAPTGRLDIKAFYGKFKGTGFSDSDEAGYFGLTQRDLDVQITPAANGGFTVAWTTVLRDSSDPKVSHFRRRTASVTFAPGPNPGMYRGIENSDPLAGEMTSWATITRTTLKVEQFRVLPDGRKETQTYSRTLSGTGMDLVYTRVVDGEKQRRVHGKLVKDAS